MLGVILVLLDAEVTEGAERARARLDAQRVERLKAAEGEDRVVGAEQQQALLDVPVRSARRAQLGDGRGQAIGYLMRVAIPCNQMQSRRNQGAWACIVYVGWVARIEDSRDDRLHEMIRMRHRRSWRRRRSGRPLAQELVGSEILGTEHFISRELATQLEVDGNGRGRGWREWDRRR